MARKILGGGAPKQSGAPKQGDEPKSEE